jgi:hypothetical protein
MPRQLAHDHDIFEAESERAIREEVKDPRRCSNLLNAGSSRGRVISRDRAR